LTYSAWIEEVIREHMEPGQRGLVVCKLVLLNPRNIPGPYPTDPGAEPSEDNPSFGWNLDGRQLGVTYWGGAGLGSNAWQEADVVFLFVGHSTVEAPVKIARASNRLDFPDCSIVCRADLLSCCSADLLSARSTVRASRP
jgi:hypothetical protein